MSDSRKKMKTALEEIVIRELRRAGFKGSFPHFRRPSAEAVDLLSFQFDRHGGGFVIEISKSPPGGLLLDRGERIPPDQVRALDCHPSDRLRLQPDFASASPADWFRYDRRRLFRDVHKEVAQSVLPFLESAEKWWVGESDAYLEKAVQSRSAATGQPDNRS